MKRKYFGTILAVSLCTGICMAAVNMQDIKERSNRLEVLRIKLASEEKRLSTVKSFKKYSDKDLFKMSSVLLRPGQERSVELQMRSMKTINSLRSDIQALESEFIRDQPEICAELKKTPDDPELRKIQDQADGLVVKSLKDFSYLSSYKLDIKDGTESLDFLKHRLIGQDAALTRTKAQIDWLNAKKSLLKGLTEPQISLTDTQIRELTECLKNGTRSQEFIKNLIKSLQ